MKMILGDYFEIPIGVTLGTVALVLLISIGFSVAYPPRAANNAGK
jgi:hypothetical protein